MIEAQVNSITTSIILDTGSSRSLINMSLINSFDPKFREETPILGTSTLLIKTLSGTFHSLGEILIPISIGGNHYEVQFVITDSQMEQTILGNDFLMSHGVSINYNSMRLCINDKEFPLINKPLKPSENIDDANCNSIVTSSTSSDVYVNPELSEPQRLRVQELLQSFTDVVVPDIKAGGKSATDPHILDLMTDKPIRVPRRRMGPVREEEMVRQVLKLEEQGICERIRSPYYAPALLIKKKDNSWRFCVDYSALNKVTRHDSYPIPHIDIVLGKLKGCNYFSVFDLASGFWQIPIRQEDKEKIAFGTPIGIFTWNVMPFGLSGAPATFQRIMDDVLSEFAEFCIVYFDDIMVFSKTFNDHLKHLDTVLSRLRERALLAKSTKCRIGLREIDFLGHRVSGEVIATSPTLTDKIKSCRPPKNASEVRKFLGLSGYYRKFIKDYSTVAEPLVRLTDLKKDFHWSHQCQNAFDTLIDKLTSQPVLAQPDYSLEFVLYTDASDVGIGAVLSQIPKGEKYSNKAIYPVIGYFSKALNAAQRNYATTDKEILAIVESVKHFNHFLENKFTLVTDHIALTHLLKKKEATGKFARWILELSNYNFDIVHRPGINHENADVPSRPPIISLSTSMFVAAKAPESEFDIKSAQKDDAFCAACIKYLKTGALPTDTKLSQLITSYAGSLTLKDDLLLYIDAPVKHHTREASLRLYIPKSLTETIIKQYHDSPESGGHSGFMKTLLKIRLKYFWHGMSKDVNNYTKACNTCHKTKPNHQKLHGTMQPIFTTRPWQIIGIDVTGPLPKTTQGNEYIVFFIDLFTRWVEAFPTKDYESTTIGELFYNEVVSRYGCPESVITDQGSSLISKSAKNLYKALGIDKRQTTTYHPQSDGATERVIGTIKTMLTSYVNKDRNNWDKLLTPMLTVYRNTPHSATNNTPSFLMFGRNLATPFDYKLNAENLDKFKFDSIEAQKIHTELDWARTEVATFSREKKLLEKEYYDKHRRDEPFEIDDFVYLEAPPSALGTPVFSIKRDGPYRISDIISPSVVVIENTFDKTKLKTNIARLVKLSAPFDPATITTDTAPRSLKKEEEYRKVKWKPKYALKPSMSFERLWQSLNYIVESKRSGRITTAGAWMLLKDKITEPPFILLVERQEHFKDLINKWRNHYDDDFVTAVEKELFPKEKFNAVFAEDSKFLEQAIMINNRG